MILFNDVVEILDMTDLDIRVLVGIVVDDRHRVGAAFVDRDLFRDTMTTDGLAQEAQRHFTIPLGCQQEAYRGAGFVDRAILERIYAGRIGPIDRRMAIQNFTPSWTAEIIFRLIARTIIYDAFINAPRNGRRGPDQRFSPY
jgi:hypothetical protein